MSKTTIEWCARPGTLPETWNPTTGCNKVSQGCKYCYAEIMHKRLQAMGQEKYKQPFLAGAVEHHDFDLLTMPFRWNKPRTVFVNSMSDLFHENISDAFIDQVFAVMALAVDHTFIIATKRAHRMYEYYNAGKEALIERWAQATYEIGGTGTDELEVKGLIYDEDESYADCWISNAIPQRYPLPNVWLLVSVEDQAAADERIPYLLQTPAAVRGLSCEPLLGLLNLHDDFEFKPGETTKWLNMIDWVICGGESGNKAHPMHPDWARSLRDQCQAAGVPFFFKQWGEWISEDQITTEVQCAEKSKKLIALSDGRLVQQAKVGKHNAGRLLDGKEYNEFPIINNNAIAGDMKQSSQALQ